MNPEVYIIAGIILGLLFTELTDLSPGGIIVPGYMALFLHRPLEIIFTLAAAIAVMFVVQLISSLFFLFGRRRYALCLLIGMLLKLWIEHFVLRLPLFEADMRLIGWLIPGIIANDMYKQGVSRTLFATISVTAMVFLFVLGWAAL